MKHVLLITDDGLFRELESAAIVKDIQIEQMAAELLRAGIQASESGTLRQKRPAAVWPPAAERRRHA